jgi:glycosyltransferase involved in cell wall biosynthesis
MNPSLTIGITCYNEGQWLKECWESVLAQDDARWEALLIMDGTDHQETIDVFNSLNHPRLRKIRMGVNSGNFPLINKCVSEARTPFYYILDADDTLPPYAARLVIEAFQEHPEADFIFGDVRRFGAADDILHFKPFDADDLVDNWVCLIGASPYRKSLWEKVGGYAEELARGTGDLDFWIGALEKGSKGHYIPEIIYQQRVREGESVSKKNPQDFALRFEIMVERHPSLFSVNNRRARFLHRGYSYAARKFYGMGNWAEARDLALKAKALGLGVDRSVRKILFDTALPAPIFKAKKLIGHLLRSARARLNGQQL